MPRFDGTFEIVDHTGAEPGPTIALMAGIHGDEDEGVLAVQRIDAALREDPPRRGIVRSVAIAHPAACAAGQRTSPLDGRNLARCFPGSQSGSASQRLAHALTERVIRGSDLLIDLHSAGREYAMPMFVGFVRTGDDVAVRAARAALAFGAPLVWEHAPPVPPGRTLSAAYGLGIPGIYVEGSGGGSVELGELRTYIDGVLRVLTDLAVTPGRARARARGVSTLVIRGGTGDLDSGVLAGAAGRFIAHRRAGDVLAAGDAVGEIVDETGATIETIRTPADATLVFLRRAVQINAGDVVSSLAPPAVPWGGG